MKSRLTRENNINFPGFPTSLVTREKNIKTCYFPDLLSRVVSTGKGNPGKRPEKLTREKNTIYIDIFSSRVRCRSTSRHESIPKGSVRFRCRHQGMHPMTSKIFPAGGAA